METAEGQLIESNQLLKTINMSGVLAEEYSPSKTNGGFKMHKVIKNSSKKLPGLQSQSLNQGGYQNIKIQEM